MIDKNTAQRYLSNVKSTLRNAKHYRRSMIASLKADIQEYISDHPDATEGDLLAYFGEPEEYAAEYAATLSPSERKRRLSVKKSVVMMVAAGILAATLIWGIGIVVSNVIYYDILDGFGIFTVR